ncbi:MAG: hypothetical protein ABI674_06670 [Spartobacteria bacterium]
MALPFTHLSSSRAFPRPPILGLLLSSLFVSLPFFSARAQLPRGVFSLKGAGGSALPAAYTNPDVAGLSIRQDWADLEPAEGAPNFIYLETEVQKATENNKAAFLRINTQAEKPAWVTQAVQDAGGTFITFNDNGVSKTIPVFWDPTYLAKKKAMIAALGAEFASNPTVKIVAVSFANAESEDWSVPHGVDDVANWIAAGYTTEKLVDAGQQLIDATMTAFPNQYVALAIGGNGHSDDPSRNLDASATEVAAATISLTRSKWPGRLIVQINSLSTFNPLPPGQADSAWNTLWNSRPDVGAQMLDNVFSNGCRVDPGCANETPEQILIKAIDAGVGYGVNYVEIYELDVRMVTGAITYAREKLAPSPTPTPTPMPTPIPFNLDGQPDAAGYLQDSSGLTLSAAVRGGALYLATSSPGSDGSQPNDHIVLLTDVLVATASQPAPWSKSGFVASNVAKPFLAGESMSTLGGWFNAMASARAAKSPGTDGLLEGTLDLAATFGSIPDTVFVAAAGYETADGGHLVAQVPAGNGDGNIDPAEFLPLSIAALKDENADGTYDRLDPALGFQITQITRVAGITTITWTSVPGRTYQAESCDSLNGEWTPLNSPITAGVGELTLTTSDPTDVLTRFYRVELVNP